jgi:hypothetical protein
MLQTEGSDPNQSREFDNKKALGATKCPAFTRVYTRLQHKEMANFSRTE